MSIPRKYLSRQTLKINVIYPVLVYIRFIASGFWDTSLRSKAEKVTARHTVSVYILEMVSLWFVFNN